MSTFPLYNAMPFAGFLAWTTGFVCNQSRGDVYGFFVLKQRYQNNKSVCWQEADYVGFDSSGNQI